ncbi:hypothetical protein ACNM5U_004108, partial [Shigella flexneri]
NLNSQKLTSQFTLQVVIFNHLFYDSQITYTHPGPAKLYPLSAMKMLLCAVGVVPTRVLPEVGAYLRVSGP